MKIHLPTTSFATAATTALPAGDRAQGTVFGHWQLDKLLNPEGDQNKIIRYRASPIGTPQNSQYFVHTPRDPSSKSALSLLRREWLISQQITNPHLLPVLDAYLSAAPYFIVTPQLPGSRLCTVLEQRQKLDLHHALWILRQVAQALCALHTHDWLTPLLNPENMILEPDGHLTLIGVGHAQQFETETEMDYSEKIYADICRLARLFLQMLGSHAFCVGNRHEKGWHRTESASLLHGLSPSIATLLTEMLNPGKPCGKHSARLLVERLVRLEIESLSKSA